MKIQAALLLIAIVHGTGTLAQDVADCTDIAAGLGTMPIDPITGKVKYARGMCHYNSFS